MKLYIQTKQNSIKKATNEITNLSVCLYLSSSLLVGRSAVNGQILGVYGWITFPFLRLTSHRILIGVIGSERNTDWIVLATLLHTIPYRSFRCYIISGYIFLQFSKRCWFAHDFFVQEHFNLRCMGTFGAAANWAWNLGQVMWSIGEMESKFEYLQLWRRKNIFLSLSLFFCVQKFLLSNCF